MNLNTLENSLYAVIHGIVNTTCIWKKQNAPQPQRPFIAMDIKDIDKKGTDDYEGLPNTSGVRMVHRLREFTLSLKCNGTSITNAMQILFNLELSLGTMDTKAEFRSRDIIYIDNTPPNEASFPESLNWVDCAVMDIMFRISPNHTYGGDTAETSIIEEVNVDSTVVDVDNTQITGTINIDGGA